MNENNDYEKIRKVAEKLANQEAESFSDISRREQAIAIEGLRNYHRENMVNSRLAPREYEKIFENALEYAKNDLDSFLKRGKLSLPRGKKTEFLGNKIAEYIEVQISMKQEAEKKDEVKEKQKEKHYERKKGKKELKNFEFDIAISFAGEDRHIAENLVRALRAEGIRVFYDDLYKHDFWGKDLREYFQGIYGPKARFVLLLISKYYPIKDWTDFEFSIMRDEAKRRKSEFILPVKLDDTKMIGIRESIAYLDYRKEGINGIVNCLFKKLFSTTSDQLSDREKRELEHSKANLIFEQDFFMTSEGNLNCIVVVGGQEADAAQIEAARVLEAEIRSLFMKTEEVSLPNKSFETTLQNAPIGKPIIITPDILNSLWYLDDWENARYGNANDQFDAWETHEEIQIQLNSGKIAAHLRNRSRRLILGGIEHMPPENIPGLIYRIDNIRIPPQLTIRCRVHNQAEMGEFMIPYPSILTRRMLPRFLLLGELYTVISAGRIMDVNLRSGKEGNLASHPFLITGEPVFIKRQAICKGQSLDIGKYQIHLNDIDVETKKILLRIVDYEGDSHNVWLPYATEGDLAGISEDQKTVDLPNAVLFQMTNGYRDEADDYYYLFSIPLFIIQALDVFHGVSGTIEAMINVYALTDPATFYTMICLPFITEPHNFGILVDVIPQGESFSFWKSHFGIELDVNQDMERIPEEFDDETDLYEIDIPLLEHHAIEKTFQGPLNYFRIRIDRIDYQEHNVKFTVIQDISSGTYTKIDSSLPEDVDIIRSDYEIGGSEKENYNMILIGTQESNSLIRDLLRSEATPSDGSSTDWLEFSEAGYKFYRNPFGTGKEVLVISGNDQTECKKLAYEFAEKIKIQFGLERI